MTIPEYRYLKQSHYVQNRISDAMSFAATITPLEGWDIVGEMKVRFDVENNESSNADTLQQKSLTER